MTQVQSMEVQIVPASVLGVQLFCGTEPNPGRLDPISNDGYVKPTGGLWTATRTSRGRSAWVDWCEGEDFDCASTRWALTPAQLPVAVLSSESDVDAFERAFPRSGRSTASGPARWRTAVDGTDFEAAARTVAGVYVCDEAVSEWWGWDVPSTLWFTWAFTEVNRDW